jgi:CRP/FNR family transcriptional regulator
MEVEKNCVVGDSIQHVLFKKGEVLFLQGWLSTSLYSLKKGMVKICSNSADGHEHIVGLSAPGNLLVGLQSICDNRYAYTGIAETQVRACKINHKALLDQLSDRPDLAMRLIEAMSAQLAHSRALMEVMGHHCAAAKIASFILLMMPKSTHENCGFPMPFSRMEMANILGLSEETVCRIMAGLKRSGALLAPRGKVEIRDWEQLNAISVGDCSVHGTH